MTQESPSSVTMLGLGMIGAPIVSTFLANGHRTTVWNRSPEKAEPLVAAGADLATSVSQAVAASPLVVICVTDYRAVQDILEPVASAVSGKTLVNLTTGTPQDSRHMARWAAAQGARYLDGAILAVPETMGSSEALLIYSGAKETFASHERVLRCLGTSKFLGADAATAALYDVALLAAMYGMYSGFFHSVALAGTEKIPATELAELVVPWLHATVDLLPGFAEEIDAGHYPNGISALDLNTTAVANIREVSRAQGLDADTLAPFHAIMRKRVEDGHGSDNLSSLIEAMRDRG